MKQIKEKNWIVHIVYVILIFIAAGIGNWLIPRILSAPDAQAALNDRVTALETKQSTLQTNSINQGNKLEWLVDSVQRLGEKLNVPLDPLPADQQ